MSATAVDRTLELLATPPAGPDASRGYIDLLGGAAPEATGFAPRLMNTGVLPMVYERWWRPGWGLLLTGLTRSAEHRLARELLGLEPGVTVLDVACGPGNFTRDFARAVAPDGLAVGIDASTTMLERAVRDTPGGEAAYVRGDAVLLPFRNETFDAVCCFAALHMFPDAEKALDHMARVLRPGGRVALLTSRRRDPQPLRTLDSITGRLSGQRMFDRREVVGLLEGRGFTDVTQRLAGFAQIVAGRLA
ncbi:MAG: methyltransferase domain-containing protein [Thermoleophilaceae bacterium]